MPTPNSRGIARAVLLCALLTLSSQSLHAHASLERSSAAANTDYKAVLRIPHGCGQEATRSVAIKIPEGLIAVKPMPKAGWSLAIEKGNYAKSHDYFGSPLASGVQKITWSGGELADDHFDEFVFRGRLVADLAVGTILTFPTVQKCVTKTTPWVEVAAPGGDAHSLKHPAPSLRIDVQAQAPIASPDFKIGDLRIEAPWMRETPDGARVAGGFMRITNSGKSSDRLLSGAAPFAKRLEVHEMRMDAGVMKMRELEKGLEIKPGETVELKPGGFHVMYMDLAEQPKAGERRKTTLVFEKAGQIDIDVSVVPRGQNAPAGKAHHH